MGMQALDQDCQTTLKKCSCPTRSLNAKMFADIPEVTAPEDKYFAEVVSHFSFVMDLNGANHMDDCFCLV